MRRDDDLAAQDLGEGGGHRVVVRRPPLEIDRLADLPAAHHAVQVIHDDRVRQSRHEVVLPRATVEIVVQVLLHEYGAPLPHPDGGVRGESHFRELSLDPDPEALRLLLEERPGPGGARVVHREIGDHAVFEADELGVLPADLEDRIDRRVEIAPADEGGAGLVGRDLVLNRVGADQLADQLPAGPGGPHAADRDRVAELVPQLLQPVGHHLHGSPLRSDVDLLEKVSIPIRHREVRGDRPDVDAEEDLGPAGRLRRRLDAVAKEDDVLRREGGPRRERARFRLPGGRTLRDSRRLSSRALRGRRRRAEGAHVGETARHHDILRGKSEGVADRPDDPGVLEQAADQCDLGDGVLPLVDAALEVARDRVAQPFQDLLRGVPFLLGVDHVALGEHGAAARDPRRARGVGDHLADLLHLKLHPVGLLVDERPRARRAVAVRIVILDGEETRVAGRLEADHLGVLPAHLEDRADLRVRRRDGFDEAAEVVLVRRPDERRELPAAPTGDRDRPHVPLPEDRDPPAQALRDLPHRIAEETVVRKVVPLPRAGERHAFRIEKRSAQFRGEFRRTFRQKQGKLHADRADVDAQVQVASPPSGLWA